MKDQAEIRINLTSDREGKAIYEALKPETRSSTTKRSNVEMNLFAQSLLIVLKADDTIALRAIINSYLRWVDLLTGICYLVTSEGSLHSRNEHDSINYRLQTT